ncbi:alpha/beta fold hydrolase [bacterium BD-1]|nr:alpha/beta fold hydrolase [Ottowia caeni]
MAALAATARREDVRTDTGTVAWRAWGSGPPLVLLHGSHGSWRHWVRNIEALAAQRTVCAPDMPGYGDSDTLAGNHCQPEYLDRLISSSTKSQGRPLPTETAARPHSAPIAAPAPAHKPTRANL